MSLKTYTKGPLNDLYLRDHGKDIFSPFQETQCEKGVLSYGISSVGYDLRLYPEIREYYPEHSLDVIDPKNFNKTPTVFKDCKEYILDPNSWVLGRSLEYISMPKDVFAIALGKSTYARCGIFVNVTPLEPGWKGYLTIEIANLGKFPVKLYCNEGILQLVLFKVDTCEVTYDSRNGKYQNQQDIVEAKIK